MYICIMCPMKYITYATSTWNMMIDQICFASSYPIQYGNENDDDSHMWLPPLPLQLQHVVRQLCIYIISILHILLWVGDSASPNTGATRTADSHETIADCVAEALTFDPNSHFWTIIVNHHYIPLLIINHHHYWLPIFLPINGYWPHVPPQIHEWERINYLFVWAFPFVENE